MLYTDYKTDLRQNGDPFLYFTNYNFSFFIENLNCFIQILFASI